MKMRGMAMLSGDELPYNPSAWTSLDNMDKLNCYDYAFGNADPEQTQFSQPVVSGSSTYEFTCNVVERGVMDQYPRTSVVSYEQPCPSGQRKIALMVDDITPSDYHFMRQDDDGYWSHKPGYLEPRRVDADGKLIEAPHTSNRDYGSYNYTHMCNYYCIPGNINFSK